MADNPNAAFKVIWTYEGEKNTYELEVPTTETWGDLKARIQELTLVKPDLQKLIGIKGGKAPADDAILSTLPLKTPVQKLMLLGTPEAALFVDPANLPYAHLLDLFGANLIRNVQGETISTGDLEGKHVFIYFSAHWCPPCRAFTPELIAFYNRHHEDKNFELVFVSSDRDQGAFNEYFGSMPWVAVAYNDVDVKNALSAKFRVRGIPTLVLLDPSGVTITTKAREAVSQDPTAEGFPWQDGGQLALAPAGLEDPVWRTQFFLGAFGDACLAGMPGIGGEATGPLQVLLHVLDSEVVGSGRYPLENEEVGAIRAGLTLLAQTVELHDGISRVRDGYEKPEDILPVLNALMQMLDAIEVGSMLVLPGGWFAPGKLHCLMHIVERVGPNEFSFVVCNSSDTEGLAYHPSQADSSSNIVYKASLKIDGISRDRMLDAAFWAMFVKMQVAQLDANRAEVLYDVLIPWLTQQELPLTIVESDPDDAATFSAAQNAPLSHYRCVMEVTRYMFRKLGLADDQIHRIFFAVRSELISMTLNDVGATQLIHHAERAVVRMGCKALAADAVEEFNERGLGVDRLQAIFETIDKIEARLAVIRTFGDQLGSLPPSVAMGTSAPMKPYPYFRHFKEVGEDQYAGKQTAEPVMPPIDFLSPTHEVATFPDALRAALQCRALCKKLIEHARSGLSGALPRQYEIIITINHCLTEVLPLPSPEESHEPCFYAHAMPAPNRDQQVKFLTAIYELANIYGAAWQSLKRPTRSMDSERALVGGCMMAIFDAAARIMASDHPLLLSILLEQNGGQKICTTVGLQPQMSFEALAKTMQFDYSPKLNGARSKVLAYFDSVDRKNEKVLFNWWMDAGSHTLQVQRMSPTMAFVRTYLSRLGLPLSDNMMETEMQALCRWCFNDLPGESPEFGMLRDMVCIFKFLATMETEEADMKYRRRVIHRQDQRWFLQYEGDWARDRIDALSGLSFEVQGMNVDQTTAFVLMAGFGRPALIYGAGPVACSPASPETHLKMSHPTEDDVLHCRHLPTFGESISEEDSEELMSYLTAEYVRVPMVSNFFASQHRLSYLFVEELRDILRASIFESGSWVAPWNEDPIDSIPARRVIWERDPLGCSKGLLLNEMEHSPGSTLEPIVRMIESVSEIPVTSVFSLNATLYLFTMEVALGVEAYILEALAEPETLDEARETLVAYRARILRFLRVIAERRLTAWMAEAEADDNMPTLCMCHAYMALLWRNTPVEEMSVEAASKMIGHTAFVSHWHEFGNYPKAQADEGELETFERLRRFLGAHGIPTNRLTSSSLPGISGSLERILVLVIGRQSVRIDLRKYDPEVRPPPADVPEYELFEMLQNQRRAILEYMQALVQQSELDTVLSEIVRVALRGERGQIQGWSEVAGPRPGSFSAHDADVIVDIQTAEIQYRNNALRALPQSIYDFADFRNVFGDEAFHCGLVARQEHRLWLRLVGVSVDLMEWDTPDIADQGIGQPRDRSRPRAPPGGAGASSGASGGGGGGGFNPNGDPTWTCNVCESINVDATRDRCELCEAWRPGRAPATAITPAAGDELGPGFEYGGSNYTRTYPSGEDSEEWIENIIRPVLQVNPNEDAVIYMTEEVTPAAASTATLISFVIDKQTSQITWKVFVAHRHFEVLHVYDLVSHGRRMYRTLVYTSNAPLALHNLQVNVQSKKRVVPDAVRFQEGAVWRNGHIGTSLVIARNNPVIRGRETFIPSSIIRGLIPSVILDNYRLWQGEDQILRGYPLDTGSPYFDTPIEITLSEGDNGDWAATVTKRRPGAKLRRIVQGAASGPDHIDVTAAAANGGAGTSTTAETSEDGDGDGDEAVTRAEKPANDVDPELLGAVRALGIDEDVARLALLASATGSADAFEDQLNAAVNWVYDPANANDVENASEILRQNAPGLSMPRSGSTLEQFNTLLEYDFDPVVIEHALKLYPGNMELALAWILDEANQADILSLRNTGSLPEAPTGGITGSGVSAVGQIIGTTPTPGPAEEEGTLTLLNLMYTDAPPDSLLHRVATIMARVEDLSHVLVWTTSSAFTALTGGACNISVIALPRLGMRFQPRTDKQGVVRLYSLDQAGWWVSDAATIDALETPGNGSLNNLLAGIPHNLVLENENSELMVMVPNCDIHRLNIIQFSTEVLLDRAAASWLSKVSTRCYFYRVHTTRTFLMADSVASTLYLVLLRLAARQYDAVFRLSETCQVDVNFTAEEARAFGLLQRLADDQTPDAHACRLKLSLGVLLGNNELPWELAAEYDGYVKKLKHVSAGCRLEEDEELEVIRKIEEEISTVANNRLRVLQAVRAGLPTAEQQGRVLKRGGDPWRLALTKPPLLGGVHHSSLSNVYYAAPRDQMIRDGELAGLMQRLETDEESGSSGKVGFLGLYDLLSPTGMLRCELLGRDVSRSFAELQTRLFQLRNCNWGGNEGVRGDAVTSVTYHTAQLALYSAFPHGYWPEVPHAGLVQSQLRRGVELANTDPENQPALQASEEIRFFFTMLHSRLEGLVTSDEYAVLQARLDQEHQMMHDICEPRISIVDVVLPSAHCVFPTVSNMACDSRRLEPFESDYISLGADEIAWLADRPLDCLGLDNYIVEEEVEDVPFEQVPFNLHGHPAAGSYVAKKILERLDNDVTKYREMVVGGKTKRPKFLSTAQVASYIDNPTHADIGHAIVMLDDLVAQLLAQRESDRAFIEVAAAAVVEKANTVSLDDTEGAAYDERLKFVLSRYQGTRADLILDYVTCCLLSTNAVADLQLINPYLDGATANEVLTATQVLLFRTARVSHINRVLKGARSVQDQLRRLRTLRGDRSAFINRLHYEVQSFANALATKRYYGELDGDALVYDPRFLVFEYIFDIILRRRQVEMVNQFVDAARSDKGAMVQQMIMGAGKTTVIGPLLALILADGERLVMEVVPSALLEMSRNVMRSRFTAIVPKRVYTFVYERSEPDNAVNVNDLHAKLDMARRKRAVVCTTPDSVKSLMLKYVEQCHSIERYNVLAGTGGDGAAGPSTPTASTAATATREDTTTMQQLGKMILRSDASDALVAIMDMWQAGVLMMDEVDVLLHPLKSELNYPIGEKEPIDLEGNRWDLPIHLLDGIFYYKNRELWETVPPEVEDLVGLRAENVLNGLREAILQGFDCHALLQVPHLALLQPAYYHERMKTLCAQWALFWLRQNFIGRVDVSNDDLVGYLTGSIEGEDKVRIAAGLIPSSVKLLNLATDWLDSLLPHCLSKINRVTYGILTPQDVAMCDPRMPQSRRLLAVPFVGKDVPSRSSEFAHPDVLLGLSILAYRRDGVRKSDLKRVVEQLKKDFGRDVGPPDQRRASILFQSWLEGAQERIKRALQMNYALTPTSPKSFDFDAGAIASSAASGSGALSPRDEPELGVFPLSLFQPNDPQQLQRLYRIIKRHPPFIHYYLRQHVFPACMNFQQLKVSASGQELGSNILFGRRLGFSGTPSNLMPADLGECQYEAGSDGRIINVLTSPLVVSSEVKPTDWKATSILQDVATSDPPFHALIDTGALITGMDNEEVARYLLRYLPEWMEGVVFLDRQDKQQIILRAGGPPVLLNQCGVSLDKRFTFYDQVHTTGMDIKQAPNARAALTIGKDMTFRDYAQGAFRMRGIAIGQTIHLQVIPEVANRIREDLEPIRAAAGAGVGRSLEIDVAAWLLINSMRMESLQFIQLCIQELHTVWRKRAFHMLTGDSRDNVRDGSEVRLRRFLGDGDEATHLRACIQKFREEVSYVVADEVPELRGFDAVLADLVEENAHLMQEDGATEMVDFVRERAQQASRATAAEMLQKGRTKLDAEVVNENETEVQQEQQREKDVEKQKEREIAYSRDDEAQNPWLTDLLLLPPERHPEGQSPFYAMNTFRIHTSHFAIDFPATTLVSDNFFRPSWVGVGERRLKNVHLILVWMPDRSKPTDKYVVLLSLAEAQTIHRMIHRGRDFFEHAGIALVTQEGQVINSVMGAECASDGPTIMGLQCMRFVNNAMFYTEDELHLLRTGLMDVREADRQAFFETCLRYRRRERLMWMDTPIAKVFTEEDDWGLLKARALVQQVSQALLERRLKLDQAFERFDVNQDGLLSKDELMRAFTYLDLGFSSADLVEIVRLADTNADGNVDFHDFSTTFRGYEGPDIDEDNNEAQDQAASRIISTWRCPGCAMVCSSDQVQCLDCGRSRFEDPALRATTWTCAFCTMINARSKHYCPMCMHGRVIEEDAYN